MARVKYVLHIYWDDDCTVEYRYFPKRKDAVDYVKSNGISDYAITKEEEASNIHFY
jgi:hypothetical protein